MNQVEKNKVVHACIELLSATHSKTITPIEADNIVRIVMDILYVVSQNNFDAKNNS